MEKNPEIIPRFTARFVNGVHVVFDGVWFGHDLPYLTRKMAEDTAWSMNRKEATKERGNRDKRQ